jgi:hypothetical protein
VVVMVVVVVVVVVVVLLLLLLLLVVVVVVVVLLLLLHLRQLRPGTATSHTRTRPLYLTAAVNTIPDGGVNITRAALPAVDAAAVVAERHRRRCLQLLAVPVPTHRVKSIPTNGWSCKGLPRVARKAPPRVRIPQLQRLVAAGRREAAALGRRGGHAREPAVVEHGLSGGARDCCSACVRHCG